MDRISDDDRVEVGALLAELHKQLFGVFVLSDLFYTVLIDRQSWHNPTQI